MKTNNNFLIIDDDETSTMLYSLILKIALGDKIEVQSFNLPNEGINFIKNKFENLDPSSKTILFLDINMPVLMGWDVLDIIEKMDDDIKKQLIIFMLSSSIDPNDKKRVIDHPLVTNFIEKPLTIEKIHSLQIF
ncbi:MAG: response regulator [Bacteroidota bacterium]|nr:response regulator [Bacteroidota bacterium]MDP3143942.1 response regulator [Bacteroidota bacterium]MDP3557559.1 response regulator [Bacteroidota bacterium]